MDLKFKVQTAVQKPVAEVFDAVYNPDKLSGYFTTGGATGPLDEGTTVKWKFADYHGADEEGFPVKITKVVPNELIVLEWAGEKDRPDNVVEMRFKALNDSSTLVSITEGGWSETQDGLNMSYGNCMGWSQMVSALKAYTEYGINLREGAYPKEVMEEVKK
ncbi:MAG TPA: SRPBCC domain-containing protein [Pyrinomonadaceae bacterium]|jgi:uncharacterized protein YndB with AHSA1/START domain|nr:SRPBCC domain-containing protein [Pyrinomonadaceae bacterium]